MPTGWRPADVAEKYPVAKIEDVYHFEKYDPKASTALHTWCWVQLVALLLFISYLFGNIAAIGSPNMFIYGGFIFLFVYALTELMDRNVWVIFFETIKAGFGIWFINQNGDWFGADKLIVGVSVFVQVYFVVSWVVTAGFALKHRKEDVLVISS